MFNSQDVIPLFGMIERLHSVSGGNGRKGQYLMIIDGLNLNYKNLQDWEPGE